MPLRGAHHLAEADDQRASKKIGRDSDYVADVREHDRAARLDEEVVAREVAEHGDDGRRRKAAHPHRSCDRAVKGDKRQRVAQQRIEGPAR